jgi:hypothetical protein
MALRKPARPERASIPLHLLDAATPRSVAVAVPVSRGLLDNRYVLGFLQSRFYPAVFTYPVLLVFGYIIYSLLWGPAAASANLGTSLTWVLWWPLIPLAMFVAGRFW